MTAQHKQGSVSRAASGTALALALAISAPSLANSSQQQFEQRSGSHVWIERPWEMHYFLAVKETAAWARQKRRAVRENATPGLEPMHFRWEEFFAPTTEVSAKPSPIYGDQRFTVVAVEFDKEGFVASQHSYKTPLRGRLNRLRYLVLSPGEQPSDPAFSLSHWFTGLGDASTHWAPGFCSLKENPSPFSKTDEGYLYGPKFEVHSSSPTFGCREWAYQLYDDERPYIDVTSYVREGKVYPKYTYIREFIGWARFGDKKPVIGKHEDAWYCLHDCPGGSEPGYIPDIKAWSRKNGWSAPKPPTKMPVFPDPPAKAGAYRN